MNIFELQKCSVVKIRSKCFNIAIFTAQLIYPMVI